MTMPRTLQSSYTIHLTSNSSNTAFSFSPHLLSCRQVGSFLLFFRALNDIILHMQFLGKINDLRLVIGGSGSGKSDFAEELLKDSDKKKT